MVTTWNYGLKPSHTLRRGFLGTEASYGGSRSTSAPMPAPARPVVRVSHRCRGQTAVPTMLAALRLRCGRPARHQHDLASARRHRRGGNPPAKQARHFQKPPPSAHPIARHRRCREKPRRPDTPSPSRHPGRGAQTGADRPTAVPCRGTPACQRAPHTRFGSVMSAKRRDNPIAAQHFSASKPPHGTRPTRPTPVITHRPER